MRSVKMVRGIVFLMAILIVSIACNSWAFEPVEWCDTQLSFYGFVRNNTGFFLQNQPFSKNSDDLATERTWLRGYLDWKFTEALRAGFVAQFAYEPQYAVEDHSAGASTATLPVGPSNLTKPYGREYSEYNNVNDVLREAYIDWKLSSTDTIKIGRQIAIWGEALTDRVGDVVQPDDDRYTLAFANLEDTRIPQWMIRGIHSIPPLNSSLEYIINPNLVGEEYRVTRVSQFGVVPLGLAGQRFSIAPSTGPFFWPGKIPQGFYEVYPQTSDMRGGFRTSTYLAGYEFGVSYFHTQEYNPVGRYGTSIPFAPGLAFLNTTLVHPDKDIIGAYMDKQLTSIPGVVRTEGIYVPNQPFDVFDYWAHPNGIDTRDYIKYALAYDLNGYFYFPWHPDSSFDFTLEHVGEVIPNNKYVQYGIYDTEQKIFNPRLNGRVGTNWLYNEFGTEVIFSYFPWGNSGLIMPDITYMPPWCNGAFSAKLQYIKVYGDNTVEGMGILRAKQMLVLTTQFNW
jgi:hypothetical protein